MERPVANLPHECRDVGHARLIPRANFAQLAKDERSLALSGSEKT